MGIYTTNLELYKPSIGEQGWGDLINGNFETIDATMAGLNTRMGTAETNITSLTSRMGTAETSITSNESRIETLETETDAIDSRIKVFEDNISFDSNGNIVGNVKGNVIGAVCANYTVSSTQPDVGIKLDSFSGSYTGQTGTTGTILTFDIPQEIGTTNFGLGIKNGTYMGGTLIFKATVSGGGQYDRRAQLIINGTTMGIGHGNPTDITQDITFTPIVGINTIQGKITMGVSYSPISQTVSVNGDIYLIPA